jgi:prepilin-type N-terminal cleavage/methylation domain-containing protein
MLETKINSIKTVRGHKPGYTLPELLITLLLISILFSIALIFSNSMGQTRKMRDYSVAVALAQQAVEVLRSSPFEALDDADAGDASVEKDLNTNSGEADLFIPDYTSGSIKYNRIVKVRDVSAKEDEKRPIGLKLVEVEVSWESPGEKQAEPFKTSLTIANLN